MDKIELGALLKSSGVTPKMLASLVGVERNTVYGWTCGARNITEPMSRLIRRVCADAKKVDRGATVA